MTSMARQLSRRSVLGTTGLIAAVSAMGATAPQASASRQGVRAVSAADFVGSVCVNTHMGHGTDDPERTADALAYAGIRNVRDSDNISSEFARDLIGVRKHMGARFVITNSGPDDTWLTGLLNLSKRLARADALLALQGPNEPNNWPVTFRGETSSRDENFLPVARWQEEFYRQAKNDRLLKRYPVYGPPQGGGASPNNVGLQFLAIPRGSDVLMPDGTRYADYAVVHNYLARKPSIVDNMTWENASSDFVDWIDGIYGQYGVTWLKGFDGYLDADVRAGLPKVSTETGWRTGDPAEGALTEEQQGRLFLNLYMAQFKRGFDHTFVYLLRDAQPFDIGYGLFFEDYSPKKSGTYVHNLTTILADKPFASPGRLSYSVEDRPETVHDLLMQKSNGDFYLAVWNERANGSDNVVVDLGRPYKRVAIYDPTVGTVPVEQLSKVDSVSLALSDHPVLVQVR
jgi:hypothetical protein